MIKFWYDLQWQATFAKYNGVKLRFLDSEKPPAEEFTKLINEHHPECSTGVGQMEIPYSDEIWDALLAEGEVVDDD